ncbi:fungal-specific transcription factor domain-containing protein [Cyathus striatus]|nr:fungal-specific transcription factor domain-containing protein [Cyathus striatus]
MDQGGNYQVPLNQALSAIGSATSTPPDSTAAASEAGKKRKRHRPILILACHERKQQCDRAKPCKRCATRGTPDECTYYQSQADKRPIGQSLRLDSEIESVEGPARLEAAIQSTLRSMEPSTLMGLQALLQLVQASSTLSPGPSVRGQGSSSTQSSTESSVEVAAAALGQLSQQQHPGIEALNSASSSIGPIAQVLRHINMEQKQSAILSETAALADFRARLPNHPVTNHLLFYFFAESTIPWIWPILHRPVFDTCYLSFSDGSQSPSVDFIALLTAVCALSLQFLPPSVDGTLFVGNQTGREALKQRLQELTRASLLHEESPPPTIERIQTLVLLALHHLNLGNVRGYYESAGMAIRMGQMLKMNRDPSGQELTELDAEIRRRLWCIMQCITLGRPYLIHEQHCDVKLPYNLDQVELHALPHVHYKPLTEPTEQTFQILQIRWSKILGNLWNVCFSTQQPTFRTVLDIEKKIQEFEQDIPPAFQLTAQNATPEKRFLTVQAYAISQQLLHARVLILRPLLLRNNNADDGISNSLHAHLRHLCKLNCQKLIGQQVALQVEGSHVPSACWADTVIRLFDIVVSLAVAISKEPLNSDINGMQDSLVAVHCLLTQMAGCGSIAENGVRCVEAVRRHVARLVDPQYDPSNPLAPLDLDLSGHNLKLGSLAVGKIPYLSDFEGHWETERQDEPIPLYGVEFPSLDALCSEEGVKSLQKYLDQLTNV